MLDHVNLCEQLALPPDKLTQLQKDAIDAHISGLVGSLERALNRSLEVKEFTESLFVDSMSAPLLLKNTPVVEILSYSVNGEASVLPMPSPSAWAATYWVYGQRVQVTYTAGIDAEHDDHLRGLLLDKATPFAVALLARDAAKANVAAGGTAPVGGLVVPKPPAGVKAFSVEGLNVTFESDAERQAAAFDQAVRQQTAARWTPAELDELGLSRLRKRVVA